MRKPSGPTLIFACIAALAAIAGAIEQDNLVFADKMNHWAVISAGFAIAFYSVLDCGLARRSRK